MKKLQEIGVDGIIFGDPAVIIAGREAEVNDSITLESRNKLQPIGSKRIIGVNEVQPCCTSTRTKLG